MNRTLRTLVVLAGVTVLAATSQATINFTNLTSDFVQSSSNQVTSTPPNLSNFPTMNASDKGGFDVSSSLASGIILFSVNEVFGYGINGTTTLEVDLHSGASSSSAISQVLFYGTGTNDFIAPTIVNTSVTGLTSTYYVSYTANFVGPAGASEGYLGGFAVNAYDAVPEPCSYAALGIGVLGLVSRRRRSSK